MIEVIKPILFWLAALSAMLSLGLMAVSHVTKRFQYWPPPASESWQYKLFWGLGRLLLIGLLGLIVLRLGDIFTAGIRPLQTFGIGLFVFGAALTLAAGLSLGVKQTHGYDIGLRSTGLYAWSRNPQYVGAFAWITGLMLFIDSPSIRFILCVVAGIYALCPFMEEPWLEQKYGEDYLAYKKSVPRFLFF